MTSAYLATICFAVAIIHTFSVSLFQKWAHRYPEGSPMENLLHLLGEVEVVFGLWAGTFLFGMMCLDGYENMLHYLENCHFTEPAFVFVIMSVCATRPILNAAESIILASARLFPMPSRQALYSATLILGPLLGSLVTEPAAMTITAYLVLRNFFQDKVSENFKYATLGLLFVNVSIGGTLLPYAAPPVLMVAGKWSWDATFMLTNFGWRAVIAVTLSTLLVSFVFAKDIALTQRRQEEGERMAIPFWMTGLHFAFLGLVVATSHHMVLFMGFFLFFLGLYQVTKEYQDRLKLREALLVGFFLGGLVILGGPQKWWLQPLLSQLSSLWLYVGTALLTAITDNAALTYLGSQVEGLGDISKYALVAGAVVGGGLTVIANAPNPAGYGILNHSFGGGDGIKPVKLLGAAIIPTLIAGLFFFPWG